MFEKPSKDRLHKMQQSESKSKIIWAIDPFEKIDSRQRTAADDVRFYVRHLKATLIPVYVLKSHADIPEPIFTHWKKQFRVHTIKLIKERIAELGLNRYTLDPVVLVQQSFSVQDAVKEFSRFAVKSRAKLILSTATPKSGLSDFFFEDSFSETLLYESRTPVLMLGGRIKRSTKAPFRILFPTDLGAFSYRGLTEVLRVASSLRAKVHFLHIIEPPFDYRVLPVGLSSHLEHEPIGDYAKNERVRAQKNFKRWLIRAQLNKVQAEFTILESRGDAWSEIIDFDRKNHYSMIMMKDKSSSMSSAVLGSNTRQVVRHATCPVWILKPRRKSVAPRKSVDVEKEAA